MLHHSRPLRAFAACLSVVAGYVDAVGFIALGGFFVSFMSGNSTRLSVGLATRSHDAAIAGGLILSFLLGVTLGSLVGRVAGERRAAAILALVACALAAASGSAALRFDPLALALAAAAMGAKNTIFERDGEVSLGVTYMTGALVKLGQRLAAAMLGGDRLGWAAYLALWLGLVTGAVVGAAAHARLGLLALCPAAGMELVLAAASLKLDWRASGARTA